MTPLIRGLVLLALAIGGGLVFVNFLANSMRTAEIRRQEQRLGIAALHIEQPRPRAPGLELDQR